MTQFTKLTHLTETMFNTVFTKVACHPYPEPDVSDLLARTCSVRCVYFFLLRFGLLSNTSSP
jgi:hypothetical protein